MLWQCQDSTCSQASLGHHQGKETNSAPQTKENAGQHGNPFKWATTFVVERSQRERKQVRQAAHKAQTHLGPRWGWIMSVPGKKEKRGFTWPSSMCHSRHIGWNCSQHRAWTSWTIPGAPREQEIWRNLWWTEGEISLKTCLFHKTCQAGLWHFWGNSISSHTNIQKDEVWGGRRCLLLLGTCPRSSEQSSWDFEASWKRSLLL